ncbi:hypothetical protein PT974_11025 [Cladobotryum mycophilum]|uniref:Uncharacterized protein n=1 Tax=Cladobotryum mycophilum TaxID=491253 RepID=A0ABR0SBG3_9HYPO
MKAVATIALVAAAISGVAAAPAPQGPELFPHNWDCSKVYAKNNNAHIDGFCKEECPKWGKTYPAVPVAEETIFLYYCGFH